MHKGVRCKNGIARSVTGRFRLSPEASAFAISFAKRQNRSPMRPVRIALAQVNPTVGDLAGNAERIARNLDRARDLGADLVAFPEMVITGYPPEDLLLKPAFIEQATEVTRSLLPKTRGMTVIVGTVDRDFDLYNAAAVLHDGKWMGTYRKRYLPNYGVFDENRYFMPGNRNPVFVRGGSVFGINICEDIWYPGGPVEEQVIRGGAEIIINVSASPYHAGKAQVRQRMLCTRAADNLAVVCYVNLVGGQDEIVYDGCSLIVDEQGHVLGEGRMFEEDLVVADVDLESVFSARLHDPRLRKGRALDAGESTPRIELPLARSPETGEARPPGGGNGGVITMTSARPALEARPAPRTLDLIEEVYEALVIGTHDYVVKNGFQTVVLGLSGGVDSALTACIAADAIGAGNVVGVSMPSRYTSAASREDAEALARALGMRLETISIDEIFQQFLENLAPSFEHRPPDTTEENLQARIRGNTLMALSNKFGWLVLATGNKSEMSVGYSTLYGDTAGGFAVIKDVYKTMVYRLSRWRNERGRVIPERTLTRAPSAELKPDQSDQDTLPPYEVLDPILRYYVEEDRSAKEISEMGYPIETVQRVVHMVDRAEYKRRQTPPGVKITPRAFGKDRRLPVTNRWSG
jgi:NAD+ synthase (glutamine-hydrolysing)